jgi:hypothetical protein
MREIELEMWTSKVNEHGVTVFNVEGFPVPECCLGCRNYESPEYGLDYGGVISGPYCGENLFMPTRKGTCKRREVHPGALTDAPPIHADYIG